MRIPGWLIMAGAAGLTLVACVTVPEQRAGSAPSPLLTSLQVTPEGDVVDFLFQVTNASENPVELEYGSGQSFDVTVFRGEETVWRWSDGQAFTQAMRSDVLEPGESRSYQARWQPPEGMTGDLRAVGVLTARDHGVEQAVRFSLP